MPTVLILNKYVIKSTGADGGHKYVSTEIEFKGQLKKLTVLFANKMDEKRLDNYGPIRVKGEILDDGEESDMIMNNATLEK